MMKTLHQELNYNKAKIFTRNKISTALVYRLNHIFS